MSVLQSTRIVNKGSSTIEPIFSVGTSRVFCSRHLLPAHADKIGIPVYNQNYKQFLEADADGFCGVVYLNNFWYSAVARRLVKSLFSFRPNPCRQWQEVYTEGFYRAVRSATS